MELTDEQKYFLMHQATSFCMHPWVHIAASPSGSVLPCCMAKESHVLGNLQSTTIAQIWNGPEMTGLRRDMLNNRRHPACQNCYEMEDIGTTSYRQQINAMWKDRFAQSLDATRADGTVENLPIRYVDIRFSNLCNLKCRICGPAFSTKWYDEIQEHAPDILPPRRLLHPTKIRGDLWAQLEPLLPFIDRFYFAGGEPLLQAEHYKILKELLRLNRRDVVLCYSTNLTNFKFGNENILELWQHFSNISVIASLDGSGERGEYLRKGLNYEDFISHRRLLNDLCPKVNFKISCTLSIYNAFHVVDLHREWLEQGLIDPSQFQLTFVQEPTHLRIDSLPSEAKAKVIERYRKYLNDFIVPRDSADLHSREWIERAIRFISAQDYPMEVREKAIKKIRLLDRIRGEDFNNVFPELAEYYG